jgi:6-phosphogluconolactonase
VRSRTSNDVGPVTAMNDNQGKQSASVPGDYYLYVGSFTSEFGRVDGVPMAKPGQGISVISLHGTTGELKKLQTVHGLISPSYLALHPVARRLYAVERWMSSDRTGWGSLTVLRINEAKGSLTLQRRIPTNGMSPCFVGVHPSGRHAYAANIESGTITAIAVDDCGDPDPTRLDMISAAADAGGGRSRVHCAVPDPLGRYVMACDIARGEVSVFRTSTDDGTIIPGSCSRLALEAGSGVRHVALRSTGTVAYVVRAHDSTVTVVAVDPESGTADPLQDVSTLLDGGRERHRNGAAHAVLHPNDRYLYVSNRGYDTITIFNIDQKTGRLEMAGVTDALGRFPRTCGVSPDGKWLLVANQLSSTIIVFSIDEGTGMLRPVTEFSQVTTPVSLEFRRMASHA